MATRSQNEGKFGHWEELPGGLRRYFKDIVGRTGGRARYYKVVDADENTLRFWQEVFDATGKLISRHEKFPVDSGHQNT